MNRQYKRQMKKQEARRLQPRPAPKAVVGQKKERTKPRQFLREVWGELQKVAWPTRQEVMGYSLVVVAGVLVITAVIFLMDTVFSRAILKLFGVE